MATRDCIVKFKNEKVLTAFDKKVDSGMDEFQAAREVVLDEHKLLHERLNGIKTKLNEKLPTKEKLKIEAYKEQPLPQVEAEKVTSVILPQENKAPVIVPLKTTKNETEKTTAAQPTTERTTKTVEPTAQPETKQAKTTEATKPAQSKVKPTVQSLTDELRNLLGNKPFALEGDANPKNRISFKDLGITESDTLDQTIDKLIAYGGEFTPIFKAIKADGKFNNVKLELVDSRSGLENGEAGLYYPVGYGEGKDGLLQLANKDNAYYTAAHELLHFFTLDSQTADQVKDTPSYKALTDMYNYIADKKGKPVAIAGGATLENYGLTNEKEFMAEMLINPTFRKYVGDVFAANKEDILKGSKSLRDSKVNSIGDIIYNLFKDLFDKIFSSKNSDVPFNEKFSVVQNATKNAVDLFFGGQDVLSGQSGSEQGATVLSIAKSDAKAAALAFPSTNNNDKINSFIKSALDRGATEEDIKAALVNNGYSDKEAQKLITDSIKKPPTTPPPTETTSKSDNEKIGNVLNQRIDARTFPTIFLDNEEKQQLAAGTQGRGQQREVDGAYVVALEEDLREVSVQSAHLLKNQLGADWGVKTLAWIEQNPSQGNIAQVIGVLNIISTENFQDIKDTHDGNRVAKLQAIQNRIDKVSIQRARDASLGLRQRILYAKFAQGGDMADVLAQSILSPELQELQTQMNEILSEEVTDAEINKAPPLKTKKPKKTSVIRKVIGKAKRTASADVKKELITKAADVASKTNKTFKELIDEANAKLKNIKC